MKKTIKTNRRETIQLIEPYSDIEQLLAMSDREFKITMITILKSLLETTNNMKYQMDNFNTKETIKKN